MKTSAFKFGYSRGIKLAFRLCGLTFIAALFASTLPVGSTRGTTGSAPAFAAVRTPLGQTSTQPPSAVVGAGGHGGLSSSGREIPSGQPSPMAAAIQEPATRDVPPAAIRCETSPAVPAGSADSLVVAAAAIREQASRDTPPAAVRSETSRAVPAGSAGSLVIAAAASMYSEGDFTYSETDPEPIAAGNLFFVAPDGDDSFPGTQEKPWRTIQKAADTLTPGQKVYVKSGIYNERVTVTRSGGPGAYIIFSAFPGSKTIIDGTGIPPLAADAANRWKAGLFYINQANWIKVKGFEVRNSSTSGILSWFSSHLVIQGNYTYNSFASGVGTWFGKDVLVEENELVWSCNATVDGVAVEATQEAMSIANIDNFEIAYNHIHHDGDLLGGGGEGLTTKASSNGIVHHNMVDHIRNAGIYIGTWDLYAYNIQVYNNISCHNTNWGIAMASEANGMTENVRVFNNLVYDNTMVGIGVDGDPGWGIGEHHFLNKIYVYNNTISFNGRNADGTPSGLGWAIRVCVPDGGDVYVRNNIVFGNSDDIVYVDPAGQPTHYIAEKNIVGIDPHFVDAASRDFHLQGDSPAIDQASSVTVPTEDFDDNPRPSGAGYDIGAFEFQF